MRRPETQKNPPPTREAPPVQTMSTEKVAYWFFRLNGCMTIEDFVVYPDFGGAPRTDADMSGIRPAYRSEGPRELPRSEVGPYAIGNEAHKTLGVAFRPLTGRRSAASRSRTSSDVTSLRTGGDTSIRGKNWRGTTKVANWLTKRGLAKTSR